MIEFEQADRSDRELDRADEHELQRLDWLDLHGEHRDFVDFYEACADQGADRAEASREWP